MRAWLTPETATGDFVCRRLSIPVELLGAVTGALQELTFEHNWEAFGAVTPADAAALMLDMLMSYTQSEGVCMEPLGKVEWFMVHLSDYPEFSERWFLCDGAEYAYADFPEFAAFVQASPFVDAWETDAAHFKVPDQMGRVALGTDSTPGGLGGDFQYTLTTDQLPPHSHTEIVTGATGLFVAPGEVPAIIAGAAGLTGEVGYGDPIEIIPRNQALCPYVRLRP